MLIKRKTRSVRTIMPENTVVHLPWDIAPYFSKVMRNTKTASISGIKEHSQLLIAIWNSRTIKVDV